MTDMPPLAAEQDEAVKHGAEPWSPSVFWDSKVRQMLNGDRSDSGHPIFRVDGMHYTMLPRKAPGGREFLGFGGREFRFRRVDGTEESSNNVWFQGRIPLKYRHILVDNAEMLEGAPPGFMGRPSDPPPVPPLTEREAMMRNLSPWRQKTYAVDFDVTTEKGEDGYDHTRDEESRSEAPLEESHVYSSEIANGPDAGKHILMVDIDHRCRLIPTSTPGHYHLVVAVPMEWEQAEAILNAMADAGIVEPGYASVSSARRGSHLRLPWVHKTDIFRVRDEAHRRAQA